MRGNNSSLTKCKSVFFIIDDNFSRTVDNLNKGIKGGRFLGDFFSGIKRGNSDITCRFFKIVLFRIALDTYSTISTIVWAFAFSIS